jgi:hypothetical protein
MQALDLYTVGVAGAGGLSLALRGNMLKPEAKGWVSSQAASAVIMALSIVMAGEAIHVWGHGGVTPREAMLVTAITVSSVVMLANLWRQRQPAGGAG